MAVDNFDTLQLQDIICCDLCVQPVRSFCNTCQLGLCKDCIDKHVKSLQSIDHAVVLYTDRTVQLELPECLSHSHQRCEAHCQHCDVPVCMKCVTGRHKGHDIIDAADKAAKTKEDVKRETDRIEGIISENESKQLDVDAMDITTAAYFDDLKTRVKAQRLHWHLEVDNMFDRLELRIQSSRDHECQTLQLLKIELGLQNFRLMKIIQSNKEILRTNKVSSIINYKSNLSKLKSFAMPNSIRPSLRISQVQERELVLGLGGYMAILKQTLLPISGKEILNQPKVITEIQIDTKQLCGIACVGSDRVWISGPDNVLMCVGIHGAVQDTIKMTGIDCLGDIAVNWKGKLMYTDVVHRTINIVRHGKTKTLIVTPAGWHPQTLFCTSSSDILVSMFSSMTNFIKVVRYRNEKITKELYQDELGNVIFQQGNKPLLLSENINNDIVVCDRNADEVIVVDKTGNVKFRYNSEPPGRNKVKCRPANVVTDSMGHIIVEDCNNSCFHILNQNGVFIKCFEHYITPETSSALGLDSKERLWVGLDNSKLAVIQYMK